VVCGERERRCERESVVDWMDVFLPLLRGVHSTPDSLSERSPSLSLFSWRSPSHFPLALFCGSYLSFYWCITNSELCMSRKKYRK